MKRVIAMACALVVAFALLPTSIMGEENTTEKSSEFWADEPLTIRYLFPENAYQPIKPDSPSLTKIKELTNVTLDFELVPGSDYETRKNTALATDSLPDVFFGNQNDIRQYAADGMFLNLMDYEDYMPNYLSLLNAKDRAEDSLSLYMDDKLYAFARLEYYRIGTAPQPMIRMDLLEKNDIAIPTTWDELYEVFLQLKELYPDKYIMATRNGTNYLIGQLAYPLGSGGFQGFASSDGIYFEPNEDSYIYGPIHENFGAVVEFLHNMYADKLLDPDYAVLTKDQTWEKLSNGKLLFYYDNDTFAARTFNPALKETEEGGYFDLLEPMTNSFGDRRALRYQKDWYADSAIINSNVERPEDIVSFFDWCYSEEGMLVTNFGIEGQTYYMQDGIPVVSDELAQKYAGTDDVLSAIQSEIGVGQFNFTPYINEEWFKQTADPVMVKHGSMIDELTEENLVHFMRNPLTLIFTDEENEELVDLQTNVMTVFNSEIDKFITGTRPLAEYESFAEELKDQGAERIQEIYNTALERMRK